MKLRTLFYSIVLYLCMVVVAVSGCIIPKNTMVMLATPQGMMRVTADVDMNVNIEQEQPPAEILKQFSQNAGEDWTDGVIVTDQNGYHLLVHKNNLQCGDQQPKNQ